MGTTRSAAAALRELDRNKTQYGDGTALRKRELLDLLRGRRLRSAGEVEELHDALCFLRAYPDDAPTLSLVEGMLRDFASRGDLRRFASALADTGIAGTSIHFPFYAQSALWIADRWGRYLTIDWTELKDIGLFDLLVPLTALYCETPAIDEGGFDTREWIDLFKAPDETDAGYFVRRFGQLRIDRFLHEALYDHLDVPLTLAPGPDTPSRTGEKYKGLDIVFQTAPLRRERPSLVKAIGEPPMSVRKLSPRDGAALIDLARSAMAVRRRDLDAFAYGDKRDVRLIDCGGGLHFAYVGMIPERRLLLETLYGYVMLKNGVPVGYGAAVALYQSAEIAYTVFDNYRGGEAAFMFAKALAVARHLLGATSFTIEPGQLGQDNDDGLRSGAWWFYQKLGFRPRDASCRRIMNAELRAMKKNKSYRSSITSLRKLASANVFYQSGSPREDVLGALPLSNVGFKIMSYLARRFGSDRNAAQETCAKEAASLLGLRSRRGATPGERLAWRRWAPLVLILPGIERWPAADRRSLIKLIRAKGGVCENDYVLRFDAHPRLRRAIRLLAEED